MLFADVRGSTVIAEGMSPADYSKLIERFYAEATDVLVRQDALIDRLVGDQVVALFVPGFGGPQHAARAIKAAQALRRRAGRLDSQGTWLPIGIGIHTGKAFVGVVKGGPDGMSDFTMLGDDVNVTARLASAAAPVRSSSRCCLRRSGHDVAVSNIVIAAKAERGDRRARYELVTASFLSAPAQKPRCISGRPLSAQVCKAPPVFPGSARKVLARSALSLPAQRAARAA
jgi:class 3 adenylate cyclase